MSGRSQASLEALMHAKLASQPWGDKTARDLLGEMEDWILEIGRHRVLLEPFQRHWHYYDRLHDIWVDTGVEAGHALLVPVGNNLGIKKLPRPGATARGWYVCQRGTENPTLLSSAELKLALADGSVAVDTLVWSAEMTEWVRADQLSPETEATDAAAPADQATVTETVLAEAGMVSTDPIPMPAAAAATCPTCRADLRPGARFCGTCGTPVQSECDQDGLAARPAVAKCPLCGSAMSPGARFCPDCGSAIA